MKQNRIFDQNSSQKARSWHYNMDTNRAEAQFADGSAIAIDCLAIEDEYGNTPVQRAELDWLLYHKPLEYAQLVLGGEVDHYSALELMTGTANIITMYSSDTTKVQVPAAVSSFFSGFRPRLAM